MFNGDLSSFLQGLFGYQHRPGFSLGNTDPENRPGLGFDLPSIMNMGALVHSQVPPPVDTHPNPIQERPDVAGGAGGWGQKLIDRIAGSMGGNEGNSDVTPEDQRMSLMGSFLDSIGPATLRATIVGNPWLGAAQVLEGTRHGYAARVDDLHKQAQIDRKLALDEETKKAETERYKAETAKYNEESQQKTAKRDGYQSAVAGLIKEGADPELIKIVQSYVDAGDYPAAEKAISAAEETTPGSKKRTDETTSRTLRLKSQAEIDEAKSKKDAGFGPIIEAEQGKQRISIEQQNHADSMAERKIADDTRQEQLDLQGRGQLDKKIKATTDRIDKEFARLSKDPTPPLVNGKPMSEQGLRNQAIINIVGQMPADIVKMSKDLTGSTDGAWAARKAGLSWEEIRDRLKTHASSM